MNAPPTCILTCDVGQQGISFGIIDCAVGQTPRCVVSHRVVYRKQVHGSPTVLMIVEAFEDGLEWLNIRSYTQRVSTISFTYERYLPVLLRSQGDATLDITTGNIDAFAAAKETSLVSKTSNMLALSSPLHSALLWGSTPADVAQANVDLENALASRAGLVLIDPICSTPLSSLKGTRREFQKAHATRTGTVLSMSTLPGRLLTMTRALNNALERRLLWNNVVRITSVVGLLITLMTGADVPMCAATMETANTGCWDVSTQDWHRDLLMVLAEAIEAECSSGVGRGVERGVVNAEALTADLGGKAGPTTTTATTTIISSSTSSRFGLPHTCRISTVAIPSLIASYLSHLPSYNDLGLQLGAQQDWLIVPASTLVGDVDRIVVPNPAYHNGDDADSVQPFLALCRITGAGQARLAVRNAYTNGNWTAFVRMSNVVCAGGSVGMDNKYFTIHTPSPSLHATATLKRFEGGARVSEFSDLRANARCLIEGQGATMRAFVGRVLTADRMNLASAGRHDSILLPDRPSNVDFATSDPNRYTLPHSPNHFDPFDISLSPRRILAWNSADDSCGGDDGSEEDIGVRDHFAECLTNIIGGRWVSAAGSIRRPGVAVGSSGRAA